MIIIKTKSGDCFVNEKAITEIYYNHKKAQAGYCGPNGLCNNLNNVESVIYVTDAQPTSYTSEGSEITKLKEEIEKEETRFSDLCRHFDFMRRGFAIYQNAFDSIKYEYENAKHEDIRSALRAIIDEAEAKYTESRKKFENVREK